MWNSGETKRGLQPLLTVTKVSGRWPDHPEDPGSSEDEAVRNKRLMQQPGGDCEDL
jgi:hypothetical protein